MPGPTQKDGHRRVNEMTPAQLARKRANDRGAQRAIRARTKDRIQRLERELEALKSREYNDVEIQQLRARNQALTAEVQSLRDAVEHTRAVAAHTSQTATPASLFDGSQPVSAPPTAHLMASDANRGPKSAWPRASRDSGTQATPARTDFKVQEYPPRHAASSRLMSRKAHSTILTRQPSTWFWDYSLSILPPRQTNDTLLINFVQDCRRMFRADSLAALSTPVRFNVKGLFEYNPDQSLRRALSQTGGFTIGAPLGGPAANHPVTNVVGALCDQAGMTGIVDRLSALPLVLRLVSWLAFPSEQTFQTLTPDQRPTHSQRTIPHSQWVDCVHWAALRDVIIRRPDVYDTAEMMAAFSSSLRLVNWDRSPLEALEFDRATGDVWLSEHFMEHAREVKNYRVLPRFVERYPELRQYVNVLEDQSQFITLDLGEDERLRTGGMETGMAEGSARSQRKQG